MPPELNVWTIKTTTAKGKRNKSKLCERKSFLLIQHQQSLMCSLQKDFQFFIIKWKKAWELTCYSSHESRPSHCPVQLNEQRRSPRRYEHTYPYTGMGHLTFRNVPHTNKGMRNVSHPEGIYRCNAQDCTWKLRSFDSSRTERRVNAFIMSGLLHPMPALCKNTYTPPSA